MTPIKTCLTVLNIEECFLKRKTLFFVSVSIVLAGVSRPNGWGRDDERYETRWLHSDLMYMAYFYTYKLYEIFVEEGDMK